ncbi:L,D-transpeptidase [Embleya sp. NBC_00888]|uniref:L,D-transpeptidase family protein n=1 Tax=Embleya sp. NBC_00888 TaxID=2975960 RepID=UPI0038666D19|nr:L,D-transpeptidase [Embleya sp. NBC_00888]
MAKRLNPGVAVAGITIAALVGVGFLAAQAANSAPDNRGIARTNTPTPTAPSGAPVPPVYVPPPVPAGSGTGKRVVYSIKDSHVWLVDEAERTLREYAVANAPVKPQPGSYQVTLKKEEAQTGSDNLRITYSVRFGAVQGIPLGFAATDTPLDKIDTGAKPGPSPSGTARPKASTPAGRSAGIRSKPDDGAALWAFAPVGTPVIVVP